MAQDPSPNSPAVPNRSADGQLDPPPDSHPSRPLGGSTYGTTITPQESSQIIQHNLQLHASAPTPSPFTDNDEDDEWAMPYRSTIYLILLTLVMAGIQIAWSVELAYISPYLLSLGVPKSTLSLIWVAGPVSGVVVQPLIGMMSDGSKFKWGRRRIFIVVSTIGVVFGFIGMGRTKEIVSWWTDRGDWESTRDAVIVLAVASLILLDLAINASISDPCTS